MSWRPPLPREHGAYGQMALPLVTSLAATGGSAAGGLFAVSVAAAFLLHEPLLVVLGGRGVRALRIGADVARRWVAVWGALALLAGGGTVWLLAGRWWVIVVPLVPAIGLLAAVAMGRERTFAGEVTAALAFGLTAVPILSAADAPLRVTVLLPSAFVANGVLSTLGVRAVIAAARRTVDEAEATRARFLAVASAAVCVAAVGVALAAGALHVFAALPFAPGCAGAAMLAFRPPPPRQLRTVGWTLAAGSVLTAVMLLAVVYRA